MKRTASILVAAGIFTIYSSSCRKEEPPPPPPKELPAKVLKLPNPGPPPERLQNQLYNLARYYSESGNLDAAFYWLQEAALREGIAPKWAEEDPSLAALRKDARFEAVTRFLDEAARYWGHKILPRTLVHLPKGHDAKKPSAVIVVLHGMGDSPEGFDPERLQLMADGARLPVITPSGTYPSGPNYYAWSAQTSENAARIDAAFEEVKGRLTAAPGKVIAFGFSQGAQVGVEIAARDPDRYGGAIVLSPGALYELDKVRPKDALKTRRFVIGAGANEHEGTKMLAKLDAQWLKSAGAGVKDYIFADTGHDLPPAFLDDFPKWVRFILDGT